LGADCDTCINDGFIIDVIGDGVEGYIEGVAAGVVAGTAVGGSDTCDKSCDDVGEDRCALCFNGSAACIGDCPTLGATET
jgi:hypothetical protein